MADELVLDFFKAARAQIAQVARWQLIVLAALLYLHIAIVAPFGARTAEKAALEREIAAQEALHEAIAPVAERAHGYAEHVSGAADRVSAALLDDLVRRFATLNAAVEALAGMQPSEAGGEAGAAVFGTGAMPPMPAQMQMPQMQVQMPPQMQMQMQANLPAQQQIQQSAPFAHDAPLLPEMPPELRAGLAGLSGGTSARPGLAEELAAYVETAVIRPAFAEAGRLWHDELLPEIRGEATEVLAAADGVAASAGAGSAALAELTGGVASLRDRAVILELAPPDDPDWWRTVMGKAAEIDTMLMDISGGVEDALRSQASLGAFVAEIEQAMAEQEALASRAADELAGLEERAHALQAELGAIGGPLRVVSFDLAILAPLLPLVIAAASGAATLLRADALRRMSFAVRLAAPERRAALCPWLAEAVGSDRRQAALRVALPGAAVGAWILAALATTFALAPPPLPFPLPGGVTGLLVGVAALGVVGACRLHLWQRTGEALDLASEARGATAI